MITLLWISGIGFALLLLAYVALVISFVERKDRRAAKLPDGSKDDAIGVSPPPSIDEINDLMEQSFAHKEVLSILNHQGWKNGDMREWFRPFLEANWLKAFGRSYDDDGRPYG